MRVVILSLDNIKNIGDELLGTTTRYLVKCTCSDAHITICQLMPNFGMLKRKYPWVVCAVPLSRLALLAKGKLSFQLWRLTYYVKLKKYYSDILKDVDRIILPIGMLKFASQDFSYAFDMINRIATKRNIPVLMSAMSIAKPDEEDPRYHQLVKAVNQPCVKAITSRDGIQGVERLKRHYVRRSDLFVDFVGDPALWTVNAFGYGNLGVTKNKKIGVNLIRPEIFSSYKEEVFTSDQVTQMYREIIDELEGRGYDWYFYDNGMDVDHQYGLKLLAKFNIPKDKLLPQPKNADEYLRMISEFRAVFGARLHACITAVSLGIPVCGMLWDNKLKFFSETMGISEFFSSVSELKGTIIVDKIEKSITSNMDRENIENYKQKTLNSIKKFIYG